MTPAPARLPHAGPMAIQAALDFLGAHAVPGLESYEGGIFTRVIDGSIVSVGDADGAATVSPARPAVVDVVRRLLDLDTDPRAVDAALARDPALAPLVASRPGLRAPGSVSGFETAVRTIVGQQISLRGARTVLGRIVAAHGEPVADGWVAFPSPSALAAVNPADLPMPRARGRAVVALAGAVAGGAVDLDGPLDRADLLQLPGIGPWTADYLRMRVAHDPDVLLATDLVVRRAAADLGVPLDGGRPDWAPWRSYATYHLWAHRVADAWAAAR